MGSIQHIDTDLLNSYIEKSGLKISFIVDKLGISRTAFDKKRSGITPFKGAEIYVLQDLCKITSDDSMKIFYSEGIQ